MKAREKCGALGVRSRRFDLEKLEHCILQFPDCRMQNFTKVPLNRPFRHSTARRVGRRCSPNDVRCERPHPQFVAPRATRATGLWTVALKSYLTLISVNLQDYHKDSEEPVGL